MKLTPQQQEWLDTHVASGEFASVDQAIGALIDARIADEGYDMAWAKPHVDEAREAVARGEIMTRDEFDASIDAQIAELQKKYG